VGHLLVDYPKVLRLGFDGIRAEARDLTAKLNPTNPKALEKYYFYDEALQPSGLPI
jgi:pyruvate formate lyase-like protein